MRCECCNTILDASEIGLKSVTTGQYLYTCMGCLEGLDIVYGSDHFVEGLQDFTDDLDELYKPVW